MSYITFDYKCSRCNAVESRLVRREEMDNQKHDTLTEVGLCEEPMTRLPAGTRTTFRFADDKLKD